MAKLIIKKEKKEYVAELNKEVTISEFSQYYVQDTNKDFHSKYGMIPKSKLKKNGKVLSDLKKEFVIIDPDFIDSYKRISRLAQMPLPKDIGLIIAETGINKQSRVVDAGGGSGGIACFLANICKEAASYEIKKEHYEVLKKNKEFLGLKNLTVKNKDVTQGIDEKNVDLIVLDMPSPWNALGAAEQALKVGGFLVIYSPTINMIMDFANAMSNKESFIVEKTVELISREWKVERMSVRPKSKATVHSGFLMFTRKIL